MIFLYYYMVIIMEYKDFDIEDFSNTNFIKIDDGTTIFNIYCMGQNIVHDLWADGKFDEEIVITDDDIKGFVVNSFDEVIQEVMKEIRYQLEFNSDINKGNIKME